MDARAWNANEWLKNNQDEFKQTVFPPLYLSVDVTDQNNLKYVEDSISKQEMFSSFFAQNREDHAKLKRELEKQDLSVVISTMPNQQRAPTVNRAAVKAKFGDVAFLDELFTAPPEIMRMLKNKKGIHDQVVFTKCGVKDVDGMELQRNFKIKTCYLNDGNKLGMVVAKYGNRNVNVGISFCLLCPHGRASHPFNCQGICARLNTRTSHPSPCRSPQSNSAAKTGLSSASTRPRSRGWKGESIRTRLLSLSPLAPTFVPQFAANADLPTCRQPRAGWRRCTILY